MYCTVLGGPSVGKVNVPACACLCTRARSFLFFFLSPLRLNESRRRRVKRPGGKEKRKIRNCHSSLHMRACWLETNLLFEQRSAWLIVVALRTTNSGESARYPHEGGQQWLSSRWRLATKTRATRTKAGCNGSNRCRCRTARPSNRANLFVLRGPRIFRDTPGPSPGGCPSRFSKAWVAR